MNLSRCVSLLFVGLYVLLAMYLPTHPAGPEKADDAIFDGKKAGGVFLLLGLVCVWAQETLGDALWGGRGAWNPKASTAGAVAALGWLFLTFASVTPILDALY